MQRKLLIGSLVINVLLGTAVVVLVTHDSDRGTSQRAVSTPPREGTIAEVSRATDSIAALDSRLRAAGFSAALARQLVLGYASLGAPPQPYEYWKPAVLFGSSSEMSGYKRLEAARQELVSVYGVEVADDSASWIMFRPYQQKYPFLSSAKQLALQEMMLGLRKPGSSAKTVSSNRADVSTAWTLLNSEISALLTKEEYFDYLLRESPSAQQLLGTGFDFSEREFRAVFAVLSHGAPAVDQVLSALPPTGVNTAPDLAAQLRNALGDARYLEFQRMQDPFYRLLKAESPQYGLSAARINTAYEVFHDSTQEVRQLGISSGVVGRNQAAVSEIYAKRDRELKKVLGDAAFEGMSRHLDMFTVVPLKAVAMGAR